jgi:FtsP/CotA-like multicopper oxidase with cupredoxin domain
VEDGAAGHPAPLPIASNADSEGRWQWRDTLFIERGSEATVRIRYEDFEGTFVAHCHILSHEDQDCGRLGVAVAAGHLG